MNYEPSSLGGLNEATPAGPPYEPFISGNLTRSAISRTNNYGQAGERYRTMPDDERDDLILNFVELFGQCEAHVVQRMLGHFQQVDADLARRVSEGLGMAVNGTGTTAAEPQLAGRPLSPEA